jgi:transglutaminase-like putative cysteine protease
MRGLRRLGPDVCLLLASLIAAAAVGRLFQGGLGGGSYGPLLAAAAVGSAVPALLARKRVPLPIRAVVGTIAVILTSLWAAIGAATTFGLPTGHTWDVAQSDLRAARPLLAHLVLPLRPAPGLVFLAAMTCGVVAILASVVLHASDTRDHVYPGVALTCPLGLLAFACSQSTAGTMAVLVILFVAASALTLTTAQAGSAAQVPQTQPITTRRQSWITPTAVIACTMAGVVLVAVLVTSNAQGAGPGPGVAPAVPLSAESLTSNLLAVQVHDANDVLFQANAEYRTYWQVAVLNVLRNGVWVPDPVTQNAAAGATNGAPVTRSQGNASPAGGSRDFKSAVQIDDLTSRILPVPPGTIALSGTAATLTTVGAISPTPTTSGQQYTTLSTPPVTESESLGGNAPTTTYSPALLQADTALPALPASIEALARAVTAGAQGPLAQAELLVNWFRSGQFHYTLDPPASPPGTDPLVSFLTQTRSGSCEQFAGAFVVLARSLGLPSRVVVGFTAGRYSGPGEVTVRGADAHAWPQVYLGPRAGWVSFEPTPQQPRGEVAPEGVVGPSGVSTTTPTTSLGSPTTAPPPTVELTVPTTVPTQGGSNTTLAPTASTSGWGLGPVWWTLIGAAAVLVVALILIRRRRRWSPSGLTPDQLALLSQAEVDRALRRAGVERPLWQPMELFFEDPRAPGADRGGAGPAATSRTGDRAAALTDDGVTVAHAANAALFDPLATSGEKSEAAYRAALRIQKGIPTHRFTRTHELEPRYAPRRWTALNTRERRTP